MDIKFNPVVDLGQIIALFGFIALIIGLLFQARALSIAKKELNLKVENLSDIISRIEKETIEREKLEKKHKELSDIQNNSSADNINYSTYVLNHVLFVNRKKDGLLGDRIDTLSISIVSICEMLLKSESNLSNAILELVLDMNNSLSKLITIEMYHDTERERQSEDWNKEQQKLLDEFKISNSPITKQKIEKRIKEYESLLDKLNESMRSDLIIPQKKYKDAVKRFLALHNGKAH